MKEIKIDLETLVGVIAVTGFVLSIIYSFFWIIGIDLL